MADQLVAQALAACPGRGDDASDFDLPIFLRRVQHAAIGGQLAVLPCHQMTRLADQVLAVDVLEDALLFDDENFRAQAQDRVDLRHGRR
ncbi:hypothetical protein G6F57_022426 [Rhizopus arrhizus]|nr:hypothetical protein G6F57_022426 [Rhizopus arrhizus]